jgi:deoxyribonuclease IV
MKPVKLYFGTAGIPLTTQPKRTTMNAITFLPTLGLDAMELEFVRGVHVKDDKAPLIKQAAQKNNIILTCHGQYWVNLNAKDPAKLQASIKRVLHASDMAWKAGAWSICFHMAYYMGDAHDKTYENVKRVVKPIVKQLQDNGNDIWLRPETGGKLTQFSDIDGLIKLSQEVEHVLPCIDWAHHCARTNGKCNEEKEFRKILVKIENELGKDALHNMHMHIEGIEWNEKGERRHLPLNESQFNYKEVIKLWKEFNIRGVAISESPAIEADAIIVRDYYADC